LSCRARMFIMVHSTLGVWGWRGTMDGLGGRLVANVGAMPGLSQFV
jgi:hypothetical protein